MFGTTPSDLEVRVAGVNHLIWLFDLKIRGQDGFRMIREHIAAGKPLPVLPDQGNWHDNFLDRWQVKLALFDLYGAFPAAGDRHLAEFFPYFLTPRTDYGAEVGVGLTTIPNRRNQVAQARETVHRAIEGELPPVSRSHEATADIVSAVANGRSVRTIVNLPNTGQIDNLPRGAVVETLADIGAAGAAPLTVGPLPLGVLGTLQPHVVNQELIAVSALSGDRRLALQAMVNDPLVSDLKVARALLDELLEAQAAYLPQFKPRVAVAA
jgi:alpha-galactosidase